VENLCQHVITQVPLWAWSNRQLVQTPRLLGNGADFDLTALIRDTPRPRRTVTEDVAYPDWLLKGWGRLEVARKQANYGLVPLPFRRLESLLFRVEQYWENGGSSDQLDQFLQIRLQSYNQVLANSQRVLDTVTPKSLALEAARGRVPDPAVVSGLNDLFTKLETQSQGLTADKVIALQAQLVAAFIEKNKKTAYFDVAWACENYAVEVTEPTPDVILLLNQILRTYEPQPRYVETNFITQLALLARQTKPADWPLGTVRLALEVVARGEKALSQPRAFPWIQPLLEGAAQSRFRGLELLLAHGYASSDEAFNLLAQAEFQFETILAYEEIILAALHARETALVFLPAYLPYLDESDTLDSDWSNTVAATIALDLALRNNATSSNQASTLPVRVGLLQELTPPLVQLLSLLQAPIQSTELSNLLARSRRETASPSVIREMDALLAMPYLEAKERASLWQARRDLALRLQKQSAQLANGGNPSSLALSVDNTTRADRQRAERARGVRRGRLSIQLLKLAGLLPGDVNRLETLLAEATDPRGGHATLANLAEALRNAWGVLLPAQLHKETNLDNKVLILSQFPPLDLVANSQILNPFTGPDDANLASNPSVAIQQRESKSLLAWLSHLYRYEARDPALAPFYGPAGLLYSAGLEDALTTRTYASITHQFPSSAGLTPKTPTTTCEVSVRMEVSSKTVAPTNFRFRVYTPDSDWLKITAQIPEALGGVPQPYTLSLDEGGRSPGRVIPLRITYHPEAVQLGIPPPKGLLVEVIVEGRAFFHLVPLNLAPVVQEPELLLSANPAEATPALGEVRLRPTGQTQSFYLYARNSTDQVRTVLVELLGLEQAAPVKMILQPKSTQRITLPPIAPAVTTPMAGGSGTPVPVSLPTLELPQLTGSLRVQMVDGANPTKVLDSVEYPVDVALPREYVGINSVTYLPSSASADGINRLEVQLKALKKLGPPPCLAELVLPRKLLPGFLRSQGGTFRGEVPPDQTPLSLFATGLVFAEGSTGQGFVYVNVDRYQRAFLFRTTFPPQGSAVTPQEDYQPSIRMQADRFAVPSAQYPVRLEVDNSPGDASVEVSLGQRQGTNWIAEVTRKFPSPRQKRIGFGIGLDGGIQMDAIIRDWTAQLDTREIVGPRILRARLLDSLNNEIRVVEQNVVLGSSAPGDVQFVNPPTQAQRGTAITLQALGFDSGTGISQVNFFLGKPVEGKLPPNATAIPGQLVPGSTNIYSASVILPYNGLGPTDISVQFTNGAGLSKFATTTVNALEKLPPVLGRITGTVFEASRPQPGLQVVLQDEKGSDIKDPMATSPKFEVKTDENGVYVIENVPPGTYKVFSSKQISGRKATVPVTVEAGKTATANLNLLL
jgi:hypothetical protein